MIIDFVFVCLEGIIVSDGKGVDFEYGVVIGYRFKGDIVVLCVGGIFIDVGELVSEIVVFFLFFGGDDVDLVV